MISFDWTLINDCSEISVGIKMLESFLDEWYLLHGKLKGLSGDNYVDKFDNSFHEILEYLSEQIDNGKLRVKELLSIDEENTRVAEEKCARIEQEKTLCAGNAFEQEKLRTERKLCAKHLYDEIIILTENICTMKSSSSLKTFVR